MTTTTKISEPRSAPTIAHVLAARAEREPARRAFTFLVDGEDMEDTTTYAELDARVRGVAGLLADSTAPGDRVVLLFPPGLGYISAVFGSFYAGTIAVPAYPPDPFRLARTLPRLLALIRDCRPGAILTTPEIAAIAESIIAETPELAAANWLSTADAHDAGDAGFRVGAPSSVALLQYTSGSTGDPKGVMLTHENLLHNSEYIRRWCDSTPEGQFLAWLPPYHDMGLIAGIMQPVYVGMCGTLMSPLSFLEKPVRWLEAVGKHRATISGGPNFAFDLCVRRVSEAQKERLDLSSWEIAFNGAEQVRAETLEAFAEAFAGCGLRREALWPCYGLAEATLLVTAVPRLTEARIEHVEGSGARRIVSCGVHAEDVGVVIADPATGARCAEREIGEVWVSGASVAAGYWRKPQLSAETFGARLADGEGPFLRTGDLGYLSGGELFVTGRIKDVIKIRGRSYYPTDVEQVTETSHPNLRRGCAAAFTVQDAEQVNRLAVVAEVNRVDEGDYGDVIRTIRSAVATSLDLQVQWVALIEPRTIPKTSSGKLQRSLCRSLLTEDGFEKVVASWRSPAPWN
jgi:acyl-CoA synthetase (AMP-forming)/AMP-acid ligase II